MDSRAAVIWGHSPAMCDAPQPWLNRPGRLMIRAAFNICPFTTTITHFRPPRSTPPSPHHRAQVLHPPLWSPAAQRSRFVHPGYRTSRQTAAMAGPEGDAPDFSKKHQVSGGGRAVRRSSCVPRSSCAGGSRRRSVSYLWWCVHLKRKHQLLRPVQQTWLHGAARRSAAGSSSRLVLHVCAGCGCGVRRQPRARRAAPLATQPRRAHPRTSRTHHAHTPRCSWRPSGRCGLTTPPPSRV
jgi:hypothetical protein